MLSPIFILWNVGYFLYNYGTIFIIILIIWQAKRSYDGFRLEPKTSCCRRHRRVKQWARNAKTKARRLSWKEAEKPWELLSIMKSQDWLPQEGSVRNLLCADTCCQICNAMTLEIKHLLLGVNTLISPTSLGQSQGTLSFEQSSEHHSMYSQGISRPNATPTVTQCNAQKSLTKTAAHSAGSFRNQDYRAEHLQLGQALLVLVTLSRPLRTQCQSPCRARLPRPRQNYRTTSPPSVDRSTRARSLPMFIGLGHA
uniref:SPATA31-like domain-containing protein n=1 Tax=Rousettus aegyptiacus TaxID=9407 RepID=A0A7J8II79_ROUAE|nr:hypothetical protein HJG63_004856 [Rousettus aegyptiacus]